MFLSKRLIKALNMIGLFGQDAICMKKWSGEKRRDLLIVPDFRLLWFLFGVEVVLQIWTTASFPVCPVAARAPELDRAIQVTSLL